MEEHIIEKEIFPFLFLFLAREKTKLIPLTHYSQYFLYSSHEFLSIKRKFFLGGDNCPRLYSSGDPACA